MANDLFKNLLGQSIYDILAPQLRGSLLPCTVTPATYTADGQGGDTISYSDAASYSGWAVFEEFDKFGRATGVPANEMIIIFMKNAESDRDPQRDDRMVLEGSTYAARRLERDPSDSVWRIRAARIDG